MCNNFTNKIVKDIDFQFLFIEKNLKFKYSFD